MREETHNTESVFDELSRAATADSQSESYDISLGTTAESTKDVERELDELMDQVNAALPTDDVTFDEALIKENLDEILLMLIALHEETHGKELLSDLTHLFGAQLSPGTVYPCLHALEEEGVLSMHAKVRTKEYSIADEEFVRSTVERTMVQHLAFGLLLYAFLPRL
ncbi:helix-turn-helix transcriptional regulator [Haloterrigena sp. SYSU A558-1]|uniref:Helix-turn-helix transcriptional regulator n=1 Tax=Haloterrigena gelatinilytica TaxID=2741724 RepID=A0A8J8GIC1_9EURY|nr:helix-turn-helix transcriptional regulator [Haloterrigena gelatinilytica]NUB89715.1 helix-turn-helix transcriptional regulator [Haloterrigena gelatinilytica]NUC74454.1 helix-turn-helix transcriptional regulator [Haloterrigena gelatinilytica]